MNTPFKRIIRSTDLLSLSQFAESEGLGIPNRCVRTNGLWSFCYVDPTPYLVYSLSWTDECGEDHEKDFEGRDSFMVLSQIYTYLRGNEGLWSGISCTDHMGTEIPLVL